MKRTLLKHGTKGLKKTRVKYQSEKQKIMQNDFRKLCTYLIMNRANYQCEIAGSNCSNRNLWGHHIQKRSKLRDDTARMQKDDKSICTACNGTGMSPYENTCELLIQQRCIVCGGTGLNYERN